MHDQEPVLETLAHLKWSAQTILARFEPVTSVDDFIASSYGLEKMDAICMQLIAIGESLKILDRITQNALLPRYPQIVWKGAIGMRDIIAHDYLT